MLEDDVVPEGSQSSGTGRPATHARWESAAEVIEEEVTWLWPGYITTRGCTVIVGDQGTHKSTLAFTLAAMASRGALPGTSGAPPCRVLIISREDHYPSFVSPRISAAGGDPDLIHFGKPLQKWRFPRDIDLLEHDVAHLRPGLIVIDPLSAVIPHYANPEKARDALEGLSDISRRHNAAILLVHHFDKAGKRLETAIGGASAISGVSRATYIFGAEPTLNGATAESDEHDSEGDPVRVLAPIKINIAAPPPALLWRVQAAPVCSQESVPALGVLGDCDYTADEVFAGSSRFEQQAAQDWAIDTAIAFTLETLGRGPMKTNRVQQLRPGRWNQKPNP